MSRPDRDDTNGVETAASGTGSGSKATPTAGCRTKLPGASLGKSIKAGLRRSTDTVISLLLFRIENVFSPRRRTGKGPS